LRHTAARLAVAEGANVKAVRRMLGHASAAMTLDAYADLFEDDLDRAADRLDRAAGRAAADSVRTEASVRTAMRSARVVGSVVDQGVSVVGRVGLEPTTEGL
jgi:ketopantoate hydroxymethyltransferase